MFLYKSYCRGGNWSLCVCNAGKGLHSFWTVLSKMKRYYLIFAFMSFVLQKSLGENQQTLIRLVKWVCLVGFRTMKGTRKGNLVQSLDMHHCDIGFEVLISHKMQSSNYMKISCYWGSHISRELNFIVLCESFVFWPSLISRKTRFISLELLFNQFSS